MSYIDKIFSIKDKVAIITGASSGIGSEIAKAYLKAGVKIICCSRSAAPEEGILKEFYVSCDISNSDNFKDLCINVYKKYGKIDILVNAAGVSFPYDANKNETNFDQTVFTNLSSVFRCINSVEKFMINGGSIINITSIGGHQGFPENPGYISSKFGLSGLTRASAVDLGYKNIRVNNLVPGYIETKMTMKSYMNPVENKKRTDRTILKRWGKPTDLIGAAIFLASDSSEYITGSDIVIDGGWLAKGL